MSKLLRQPQLPIELYSLIIAHLPSPRHRCDLFALAITSKATSRTAIRELYRRVTCLNSETVHLFFKRFTTGGHDSENQDQHIPDVCGFVHSLKFTLPSWPSGSLKGEQICEPDRPLVSIRDAFRLLHNIKELVILQPQGAVVLGVPSSYGPAWLFQDSRFSLTHLLSMDFPFDYNDTFENFLQRHSQTLQILHLIPDPIPDGPSTKTFQGPLTSLDVIATTAEYLAHLWPHIQPTKIWDIFGEFGEYDFPTEGRRIVTSYRGSGNEYWHSGTKKMVLHAFGCHLRFIELYVEIKKEETQLYQALACLPTLRAPQLTWDIRLHTSGNYTPTLVKRFKGVIKQSFKRCPSPHFEFLFSIIQGKRYRDYGQQWTKGLQEGVGFVDFDELWVRDW